MTLITDPVNAELYIDANLSEVEEISEKKYKMPTEIKNPLTPNLGKIGSCILDSKADYELELSKVVSSCKNPLAPEK